jgi:hypothetical protein
MKTILALLFTAVVTLVSQAQPTTVTVTLVRWPFT